MKHWIVIGLLSSLAGCVISNSVSKQQDGEFCPDIQTCKEQQRAERDTAIAIENEIAREVVKSISGATDAKTDTGVQNKSNPGYQCAKPNEVTVCSALDGCKCTLPSTKNNVGSDSPKL